MPNHTRSIFGPLAWLSTTALLAGGCEGVQPTPPRTAGLAEYCLLSATPNLRAWNGDVLTTCPEATDEDPEPTCALFRVVRAQLNPISLPSSVLAPVWAAPTGGGGLVVLEAEGRLVRVEGATVTSIAEMAGSPTLDASSNQLLFVTPAAEGEFGLGAVLEMHSLTTRTTTRVVEGGDISAPFRAASGDIYYISTDTGVASVYRVRPGSTPEQITNVGETELSQESVPAFDEDAVWGNDTTLYYRRTGLDGTSYVMGLDVATGEVEELGPGAWPRLNARGDIFALAPVESTPCAFTYAAGGAP